MNLFLLALMAAGCVSEIKEASRALEERQPLRAAEVLDNAAGICPGSAEVFDLLGIVNDMLGRADRAQQAFRKAIELDPRAARPRINLAVSLNKTGRGSEALRELDAAVAIEPANLTANVNLASYYIRQRDLSRALRAFEAIGAERSTAVRQDPQLLLGLTECLLAARQVKRAVALLPPAAEKRTPSFRFSLGTMLASYGFYREAIEQLRTIPGGEADAAVLFNLGLAHSHLRQYTAAREYYFAAIDRDPHHTDAYFRVGLDFSEIGNGAKAIPWLLRSKRMAPDRADIMYALAEELIAAGYFQTAGAMLASADSGNALLQVAQGDCALGQQQLPAALAHYRRALELDPQLASASIGLARALAAEHKGSEGLGILAEILAREPGNIAAHAEAGMLEASRGNCAAAVPHLEQAWAMDHSTTNMALSLARCYRQTGQPARGLEILLAIRSKAAGDRAYHYELSGLYTRLKRPQDAQRELSEMRKIEKANQEGMRFVPPTIYIH